MAVLIPPSISSLAASNPLAGIGALAPASGNRSIAPVLPGGVPASTSVFLSEIAQRLLTRLAADPNQDIDAAFAEITLDLTRESPLESQLFSRSGLPQPVLSAPVLAQLGNTGEALSDTTGFAEQARLNGEQSIVSTQNDAGNETRPALPADSPVTTRITPTPISAGAAEVETATPAPAVTTTAATPPAPTNGATPAITQPTANAPTTNPANGSAVNANTPSSLALNPATPDVLHPFQQTALIAGLTSFAREQVINLATPRDIDDTVIEGISAVMPVQQRRYDSTEAWLSARR